jgi:hypothetical protein
MAGLQADANAMAILGTKALFWAAYAGALGEFGDRLDVVAARILTPLQ